MSFNRAKHIKYWRMCSNVLPDHYISTDSSRMTLGFFIVAALDLLDVLDDSSVVAPDEKAGWIEWIYACQLPTGGFRGTTGMDLRRGRDEFVGNNGRSERWDWDPASVPATFFALAALLVLGDDLARVKREETLQWLPSLQRTDGSFGEVRVKSQSSTSLADGSSNGERNDDGIEGGRDLRYCCCAAGIAYILSSHAQPSKERKQVINEDRLVEYIRNCQNYNGGFGESPGKEPHSGLTYCAVAALGFVARVRGEQSGIGGLLGQKDKEALVRWMLERQTGVLEEDDEEDEDEDNEDANADEDELADKGIHDEEKESHELRDVGGISAAGLTPESPSIAGFNGRDGKIADTCYCWWNTGALAVLDSEHFIDTVAMRKYLCEKVQHMIGGFGKGIGAPPDVLHSYLGLAALAVFDEAGINSIDPVMCVRRETAARVEKLHWKLKV